MTMKFVNTPIDDEDAPLARHHIHTTGFEADWLSEHGEGMGDIPQHEHTNLLAAARQYHIRDKGLYEQLHEREDHPLMHAVSIFMTRES